MLQGGLGPASFSFLKTFRLSPRGFNSRQQRAIALEHERYSGLDRQAGRIQDDRAGSRLERRRRPAPVARVSFADVAQKIVKTNRVSFFYQLLITAHRAL